MTTSSGKVSQTPVNYTFSFTPAGDLPSGNVLKITLPSGVTVGDIPSFTAGCGSDQTGSSSPLTCSISG